MRRRIDAVAVWKDYGYGETSIVSPLRIGFVGAPGKLDDAAQMHPSAAELPRRRRFRTESGAGFPRRPRQSAQTVARKRQARSQASATRKFALFDPAATVSTGRMHYERIRPTFGR